MQARLLLRKARQDAVIVSKAVDDADIADEIVGFHVRQAGETRRIRGMLA